MRGIAIVVVAFLFTGLGHRLGAESLVQSRNLADGTLYSGQTAREVGDLVTLVIKETTVVSESQETEKSRENTTKGSVNLLSGSTRLPAAAGQSNVGTLPAIDLSATREFEGEGEYKASGTVSTRLTGRVTDVLDNGNLVIEARRAITINDDIKTILLTGIGRTADIDPENTVKSERLHNFKVSIVGEGPLTRAQQEGLLGRLIDVLWPL